LPVRPSHEAHARSALADGSAARLLAASEFVKDDSRYRALLYTSAGTALVCLMELLWLRSADVPTVRMMAGWLFLPWLAAAVVNLALWHLLLSRGKRTPLKRLGFAVFWLASAAFAVAFAAMYGMLWFGWI
jgi:hypothetical protein